MRSKTNKNSHSVLRGVVFGLFLTLFGAGGLSSCASLVDWLDSFLGGMPSATMPGRSADAMSGSAFLIHTRSMTVEEREEAIFRQLVAGNIPSHVRHWVPVTLSGRSPDGSTHTGEIFVLQDYLAIGSDADFVRIPMSPMTAQRVADEFGSMLPTRKMVDAVYRQAVVHAKPHPLPPGPQMTTSDYYLKHAQIVGLELGKHYKDGLIAGHKKDVVISNLLWAHPGRVAIYGWHTPNGEPIQPLSIVHPNWYADYSHGIRLIRRGMKVDGRIRLVSDVLQDPQLSCLVSDEGTFKLVRQPNADSVARTKKPAPREASRM